MCSCAQTWQRESAAQRPGGLPGRWVGGHLGSRQLDWTLASGGATLEFVFSENCVWLDESVIKQTKFNQAILAAGDVVAVKLGREAGEAGLRACAVALLAPGRDHVAKPAFDLAIGRRWADFTTTVRAFFVARDFIEARTPTLVASPGTEPYLEAFETHWQATSPLQLYLPTSPEFHLKRLLTDGWTRVFEFKECFRNGERDPSHQPEFLMLEWYRAYATLDAIAADLTALLAVVATALRVAEPGAVRIATMRELFVEHTNFVLTPETSEDDLRLLCRESKIDARPDDAWDDLFFRVFLAKIEPAIALGGALLIRDYPPRLAGLARLTQDGWADRLELYWKGLELANGFHELNDPAENRRRFASDSAIRRRLGRTEFPIDQNLLQALDSGMPPSAGIALGMDRLFMALTGLSDIALTRPFPF